MVEHVHEHGLVTWYDGMRAESGHVWAEAYGEDLQHGDQLLQVDGVTRQRSQEF